MNTLKERFEEEYKNGAFLYPNLGQPNWDGVLAFFRQELLSLAEEVQDYSQSKINENAIYQEGRDAATELAIIRIRAKADELR